MLDIIYEVHYREFFVLLSFIVSYCLGEQSVNICVSYVCVFFIFVYI